MKERRKLPRTDKPLSLRIPPAMTERINQAAAKLEIPFAEALRLAVGIGLVRLDRIDYKIAEVIDDAAGRAGTDPIAPVDGKTTVAYQRAAVFADRHTPRLNEQSPGASTPPADGKSAPKETRARRALRTMQQREQAKQPRGNKAK